MTNGEKICVDFPNMRYTISEHRVITTIGVAASFDLDWWNAEYKEPTNNDSGVDYTSRQATVEFLENHANVYDSAIARMAFRVAAALVSNPNNVPSVTPQPKCEDVAKAFQMGLLFGFGEKHDNMDRIIDEIKKGCKKN